MKTAMSTASLPNHVVSPLYSLVRRFSGRWKISSFEGRRFMLTTPFVWAEEPSATRTVSAVSRGLQRLNSYLHRSLFSSHHDAFCPRVLGLMTCEAVCCWLSPQAMSFSANHGSEKLFPIGKGRPPFEASSAETICSFQIPPTHTRAAAYLTCNSCLFGRTRAPYICLNGLRRTSSALHRCS